MSISRVQGISTWSNGTVSSLAFPSNVTQGNLLLVSVVWDNFSAYTTTISDTLGNTWNMVAQGGYGGEVIVLYWAVSKASGTDTVSISWQSGAVDTFVAIEEFSGVASVNPFDGGNIQVQNNAAAGTGTPSSGSFTTLASGDLIYAVTINTHNNSGSSIPISIPSGWNAGISQSGMFGYEEYAAQSMWQVQSSAGSISPAFNTTASSGNVYFVTVGVAFIASGAPRGAPAINSSVTFAGAGSGGDTSGSIYYGSAPPNLGDIIVLTGWWDGQSITATPSDDAGNTYTPISPPVNMSGGNIRCQMWWAANYSSPDKFTLSFSSAVNSGFDGWLITVMAFRGASGGGPVDGATVNSATGANGTGMSVTSGTPSQGNELMLASFLTEGPAYPFTGTSGWTSAQTDAVSYQEFLNISNTAAQTATATGQASTNWVGLIFGLKAASGSGSGTLVSISASSLALSPKTTHINEVYVLGHASLTAAGKALHVNEAIAIARTALSMVGKNLHVNEAVLIAKATLTAAAKAVHINEVVVISKAAMNIAGKNLIVLGATLVAIARAVMSFVGQLQSPGYFGNNTEGSPAIAISNYAVWASFVCPGIGQQQVEELSAYVNDNGSYNDVGADESIRLAIYTAAGALVCQGGEVACSSSGNAWVGYFSSNQITPNPAVLTGRQSYYLIVAGTAHYDGTTLFGTDSMGTEYYASENPDNPFTSTLPSGTPVSNATPCIRCAVSPYSTVLQFFHAIWLTVWSMWTGKPKSKGY